MAHSYTNQHCGAATGGSSQSTGMTISHSLTNQHCGATTRDTYIRPATGLTGDTHIPTAIRVTTVLLTYYTFLYCIHVLWLIANFSCIMQTLYIINNKYDCMDQK